MREMVPYPYAYTYDIRSQHSPPGKLCERYGGGGHPAVGAILLPKGEVDRAKQIASEVVAMLAGK